MAVQQINIFSHYDVQRFDQFGSMDCANWYIIQQQNTKLPKALYPSMGRRHLSLNGQNTLNFNGEPSQLFRSINYVYAVVGTQVIQVDKFDNQTVIGTVPLGSTVWFSYLVVGSATYCAFTTGSNMYIFNENTSSFDLVTDPLAPSRPEFVATFGDRFVVSDKGTPDFYLTTVGVPVVGSMFTPATFARASGVITQFAVLHAQLFIFTDFDTDIWSNSQSQITVAGVTSTFPWKRNTSFNFNVGLLNPFSLDVDFGRMVWLAKNQSGLVSFMTSNGGMPQEISTEAIDVLLENSRFDEGLSPFLTDPVVDGFLYQYENTIFYRVSAGKYKGNKHLDCDDDAKSLEYNFNTGTWNRVTEVNGERNRIKKHVFFNNRHLVTVQDENSLYEMAGNIYSNELRNPNANIQDDDAYIKYPIRYQLVTEPFFMEDYAEFITDYLQIDFVFGNRTFFKNETEFENAVFLIAEDAASDGSPIYIIAEDQVNSDDVFLIPEDAFANTMSLSDDHYNTTFAPHLELYYSDDGGVSYHSADVREFSALGNYRWRMRWYELGPSRNRKYKLVGVARAPLVPLGAVHSVRRASGDGN